MPRKTAPLRAIREDETYSEKVVTWAAEKYPTVDIPATFEVFADHCRTHGSMYACFDAALRTWVRNAIDKGYGGAKFKQGIAADPKWIPVLAKAKEYGFRPPELPRETADIYGKALQAHIDSGKRSNVTNLPAWRMGR